VACLFRFPWYSADRKGLVKMALDDVYAITVFATQYNTDRLNTFHARVTDASAVGNTELALMATDFKEITRPNAHNTVTWIGWRARQVRGAGVTWPDAGTDCQPTGGAYFEGTFSSNTAGPNFGQGLPPQCALVTTLRTAQVGRTHRGRVYHYGLPEDAQGEGAWVSGTVTMVQTAWNVFLAKYAPPTAPLNLELGVWSFTTASGCIQNPAGKGHIRVAASNEAQAFTPVTSALVRSVVYTQRRRVTNKGR
jgi:hypothetical protein